MRQRITDKLEHAKSKPRKCWRHERLVSMSYHWLLDVVGCDRVFVEPWVEPPFMEHPDVVGYKQEVCYVIECKTRRLGQWIGEEKAKWRSRPYSLGDYRWFCGPPEAVLEAETKLSYWADHGILLDTDDRLSEFRTPIKRNTKLWTGAKDLFAPPPSLIGQRRWPKAQKIAEYIERCRSLHFYGPGRKPPGNWYMSQSSQLES